MVMELWNSYHNSYQVTFDFLQVNILYNKHIMGLVRIMVRIKRNPFSRIVYDIFSISIWMSKEIKNHSPSPGLLFFQTMGSVLLKNGRENRTFGEVCVFLFSRVYVNVCLGKGDEGIPGKIVCFFSMGSKLPNVWNLRTS